MGYAKYLIEINFIHFNPDQVTTWQSFIKHLF